MTLRVKKQGGKKTPKVKTSSKTATRREFESAARASVKEYKNVIRELKKY